MKLNEKQKIAVFDLKGNSIISASPGSGKTKTLVSRALQKVDESPRNRTIALITYTNAGADEISSRLATEKEVFIGTIHSFCLEYILRPFSWIYNWDYPKIISYEQLKEFIENYNNLGLDDNGQNIFDELSKIKKKLNGELDCDVEWNHEVDIKTVADIYYEYLSMLKVIDFNEILYRSYKICNENNFVTKSLSSKFYEILVDEFQDTNIYQYEILKKISAIGSCSFFMVGDEKQRIFSFAGAIEDSFEMAKKDFNAVNEELIETYRSSDHIVNTYSKLFENHPEIINSSENKYFGVGVQFFETNRGNHDDKLHRIVDRLVQKYNIELSEIAILSTSWRDATNISRSLRHEYNIVGSGALPHKNLSNSTFSLLKSLARCYFNPEISAIRSIKRNIEMHILENGLQYSKSSLEKKTNLLISNFLTVKEDFTLIKGISSIQKIFNDAFHIKHSVFEEILELIPNEEKELWQVGQYLKVLTGKKGIFSDTIHKSKGLEFDAVILNGINENRIPYQKCISRSPWDWETLTEDSLENGRTLFYVAVSRARKILIILHNWKPSLFIDLVK